MKKKLLIPVVLIIVFIPVIAILVSRSNNTHTPEPEPADEVRRRISEPVNEIPVSERPWVEIKPTSDGKHLVISIKEEKNGASQAEYTLEYIAGTNLRGFDNLFQWDQLPISEEMMLGSCSAGGKCSYDTDIKGGTITLRFPVDQPYAVQEDWVYFTTSEQLGVFTSSDQLFTLEIEDLTASYLIILNSPGYPGELDQEPLSALYSVQGSSELTQTAIVSINYDGQLPVTIVGFDGEEWQEFETTVNNGAATAEVELLPLFTLVEN